MIWEIFDVFGEFIGVTESRQVAELAKEAGMQVIEVEEFA